ncbi:MAG TPA: U32 family peptidase [Candidatus Pullichristensenella stercorigallinarum]|uniref:U32 family peptidase n=1 Tax=Candidatus Pullichristensenella stercorigallinarum TaxID=2840909 RepID=A0A9D0ZL29_9FIRM|nr:U32 family peptidase [Candidatus Pullichristensenella stercorigallinarum]
MSELLSPAGSMEALTAAVQNGADAVYFGARLFNARRGADNFDGDGLERAVSYCHARGVRAHVTLNTLVREDETAALEREIAEIAAAGADAVIVQDLGVAARVRRLAPQLSLHASTQMAVHNRQGVEYLRGHGFDRAVLAREMPLSEIEKCAGLGVELEAFCHGALCVSCSGQCLFSSLVGGRSGNRGMCAQPCRLPYRLGEKRGYLLSPRDLMLLDDLRDMERAGVVSFKIEGRLKRPEYVAVVTAIYRRALDGEAVSEADREALLQIFNRGGFSRGYLRGMNDAALMYSQRPNHMGVLVGENGVLRRDVDAEDALVERAGGEERPVKLQGRAGTRVAVRGKIYRLTDARQMRLARESYAQERRTVALTARLTLRVGEKMRLRVSDGSREFEAAGESTQAASSRPLDPARVRAQVGKTGGTPYVFAQINLDADETAFAAAAQLNALRREALEGLTALRLAAMRPRAQAGSASTGAEDAPLSRPETDTIRLIARSDRPEILLEALQNGADEIVFDPCDLRRGALDEALRALAGHPFALALPAVANADVLEGVRAWARTVGGQLTAVYAANVAHLGMDWGVEVRGDFALNLFNARAVAETGLMRYMPSLELTARQAAELPGEKELLFWGRAPLMRLRHCPLRAAQDLSGPHDACRRCDRSATPLDGLALIDRRGAAFPLRRVASDGGCVVEVLNSVPHWLLPKRARLCACSGWVLLLRAGEPAGEIVRACRAALAGGEIGPALPENLQTTSGHSFRGVD